jgi:putative copper export protein
MYGVLLLLHVLGATVWTGGHLILALTILPKVLREKSPADLLRFESAYERIGMPALVLQVLTGVWFAYRRIPDVSAWFPFDNPVARLIAFKLILLGLTVAFAIDARLRVIPKLSPDSLTDLAWHVIPVTILAVLFVFVGVSFRTGWAY